MTQKAPLGCGLLILSAIVGLATIAGFFWIIFSSLQNLGANSQRFAGPGSHVFTVEKGGRYTLFHETSSQIDGTIYMSPGTPSTMTLKVLDANGVEYPLLPSAGGTYSVGSYVGDALFDLELPAAGDYTVNAELGNGQTGPIVIALGQGIGPTIMLTVFGGVSVMFIGLTVSSLTFIVGLVLLLLGYRRAPAG